MYEAVYPRPAGEATVSRYAATLAETGFEGVVVREPTDVDGGVAYDAAAIGEEYGLDVVDAVEVVAENPSVASGTIGGRRPETTLLVMRGGTPKLNRFAAEEPKVDVLSAPMRGRGDVNHVIAKAAREHGVRVEFDFSRVLRRDGGPRVRALRSLRKLREIVDQYDVPYVVSVSPHSHLHVRAPREVLAVGELAGFDREWLADGFAEWGRLAARNRERMSAEFIAPGVRRGTYEEDD